MKTNTNCCCIFNTGPHYRLPVYQLMDSAMDVDFYIGDKVETPVKTFDYGALHGFKGILRNHYVHHFYWQSGAVRQVFKPYKYYIMSGEPYCLSSWVLLLMAKLLGKKTIAWTHGWYGREGFVKELIKKTFFRLFYRLMVYSQYSIDLMVKEGFDPRRMYCIANSMDSDKEKALRLQLKPSTVYTDHFHSKAPVVIYCGRIQKVKRLDELLLCVKALKDEGTMVNIVFVGADVDGVGLDKQAASLDIASQVWLYGPCYDDCTLGELFYNATVCVSPGNVGLTAIHALSFGCPVLTHGDFAHQMPEFEAICPGNTGDFFRKDDLEDMRNTIRKWITMDPAQREAARKNAYEEIDRKWNIHYQLEILKKVIRDE